jgi:hypothetical protein
MMVLLDDVKTEYVGWGGERGGMMLAPGLTGSG